MRWFSLLGAAAMGCASSVTVPPRGPLPREAFRPVPYPPPAARVELVPDRPRGSDAVWVDGSWTWRGSYYVWQRGGWVLPARDAKFAHWAFVYEPDGTMLHADACWLNETGKCMEAPPIRVPAETPPNEVTTEFETPR